MTINLKEKVVLNMGARRVGQRLALDLKKLRKLF